MRRHGRRAHAPEGAHVVGRQGGVGHDQPDGGQRHAQLLGHHLRQRRAQVLADLHLAGVGRDLAVRADVQPGADLRRHVAAKTAPAAPPRLLSGSLFHEAEHDQAAACDFEEVAPVEIEGVRPAGEEFVALRFEMRKGRITHGLPP